MDSFHVHFKLNNLKRLGNLIRFIEICVFLIFISRVSFQFQFQFPVIDYVKKLFSILLSHRFVFVIGNVIVITLFAKSRKDSHLDHTPTDPHHGSIQKVDTKSETQSASTQVVTFETERSMRSVSKNTEGNDSDCPQVYNKSIVKVPVLSKNKTCFKRSYSECLEVEKYIKPRRILRRTATEGCRPCGKVETLEGYGDGMSDEEFRVMVETFIAKQQRSLREEENYLYFC